MSFEIKYDLNGDPIRQSEPEYQERAAEQHETAAPQEVEQVEEHELPEETVPEQPQPQYQKPAPQQSWRDLREKAERAREKAERAERRAQELEQIILDAQTKEKTVEEDLDVTMDDDSLVEGKHLSKVNKKIQNLERQLKQYEQQSSLSSTEAKLKTQYPDFDRVVSEENLNDLRNMYPEIAHTINSSDDLYSKAVAAYTMIKKLGIMPEVDIYKNEKDLAQKNAAKPKSLASISPQKGDNPLSKANAFANGGDFSDELKSQLWKEMNQYRR